MYNKVPAAAAGAGVAAADKAATRVLRLVSLAFGKTPCRALAARWKYAFVSLGCSSSSQLLPG